MESLPLPPDGSLQRAESPPSPGEFLPSTGAFPDAAFKGGNDNTCGIIFSTLSVTIQAGHLLCRVISELFAISLPYWSLTDKAEGINLLCSQSLATHCFKCG